MSLDLSDSDKVDDLAFIRDAPPATTQLEVKVSGPADFSPLADCPALKSVVVSGGSVSAGLEILSTLPELNSLFIQPPDGGQDLSFLANCSALISVAFESCTEMSGISVLISACRLRDVYLFNAKRLRDLDALNELLDLRWLLIENAPLTDGLAAVSLILDKLKGLIIGRMPTVTSLDALTGRTLEYFKLRDCPVTDLEPLGTLQSLTRAWLERLPNLTLAPLASLPHLCAS